MAVCKGVAISKGVTLTLFDRALDPVFERALDEVSDGESDRLEFDFSRLVALSLRPSVTLPSACWSLNPGSQTTVCVCVCVCVCL